MSGSYLDHVARAPLFDRLSSEGGGAYEVRPFRTLTYRQLLASVRREIEDLLNTRCPLPSYEIDGAPRTVLDYGLPDFAHLNPLSPEDQRHIARQIARTIEAFEPRLREVYAAVERYDTRDGKLSFTVSAILLIDRIAEPVSFPFAVSMSGAG